MKIDLLGFFLVVVMTFAVAGGCFGRRSKACRHSSEAGRHCP